MVTINRAIDHLIDVLAGEDVPVVGSKATRVDQLANMIFDGEIVIGGGGDDSMFVVKFTEDEADPVADKTLAEILAAQEAGKVIVGTFYGAIMPLVYADAESGALFQLLSLDEGSTLAVVEVVFAADGTLTETQTSFDLSSLA